MPEVVASIMPRTPHEALCLARRAALGGADWIELRLDRWPADARLGPVLGEIALPVLAACRLPRDGGSFRGHEEERRALLGQALAAGAEGLDLEHWVTWTPPRRPRLLVRSFHDVDGVPRELSRHRARLHAMDADVAKLVVRAADLADAAPALALLAATDQTAQPTVAFSLGAPAWSTRLLACLLGAPLVYGCADAGEETAPGQVPVDLLVELYRARALGPNTRLFGLLGRPANASLGPWLHNRLLRRLGLDAVYLPLETARPEEVVAMLPARRLGGLSVTAPHKERARHLCHRLDADAALCGAVNTLCFAAGDQVVGGNTDVIGGVEALRGAGFGCGQGRAGAVLGTGGAARAGAVALERLGFAVTMLGRRPEAAADFARSRGYGVGELTAAAVRRLAPAVVVHATPVGSAAGADPGQRLLPDWSPSPGTGVLDMVSRPRITPLLAAAAAAGAVAIPGAEMFLAQAAAQAALFTGARVGADELRRFLPA